jgi:hypothetical protein
MAAAHELARERDERADVAGSGHGGNQDAVHAVSIALLAGCGIREIPSGH